MERVLSLLFLIACGSALSGMPTSGSKPSRRIGKAEAIKTLEHQSVDELTLVTQKNPQGLVKTFTKPVVIDEAQRWPEFLAIRRNIDLHREPARYILTGSAHPDTK